ncbi:QsdR family transcriptional regulator [Actinocorallia longicatena]|uniref:QsdR TetR regulatory C-terminal domain-containing protein n=1 Tax=Actinocorallia longicatena TaxID=111803 RepID=A0ABP6QHW1_9ACTN
MSVSETRHPEPPERPRRADADTAVALATRDFLLGRRIDMRALAAELGVGRTTLYRWVGDREALLAEALARLALPILDRLWLACPGSGGERIADLVEAFMTNNTGQAPGLRVFSEEPSFALRVFMSHDNALFHTVRSWFADRLAEEGLLTPEERETIATTIVGIVKSYSWARIVSAGRPDIAGARTAVSVLLARAEPSAPRWDTDGRGTGVASGAPLVPGVHRLLGHLDRDGWVAEEPEHHLLPHLETACAAPGSAFRLTGSRTLPDGVFEVSLEHTGGDGRIDVLRDAVRLLAAVAEPSFFVRQVDPSTFDCATGVLDGDPPGFAAHGHLLRLAVTVVT